MLAGLFSYLPTLMHHLVQHEGRARSVESIPQVLSRDRCVPTMRLDFVSLARPSLNVAKPIPVVPSRN